jgi:hypothetical protein
MSHEYAQLKYHGALDQNTSLNVLKAFNQNKGVHAIFVSKEMLDRDPNHITGHFGVVSY